MSDIAIKVEHLSKVYKLYDKPVDRMKEALSISRKKYGREHYALKDISFEIKRGETFGIIGTNGSGKSTLLKIITGVLTPTSGNVIVNGKVSALLELGAGFNPEYTGLENIYLNGTMMGYTKEEMEARVEPIVEFADIGEFIHQPVKTYSSGMFARLAFAVAINVEPDILIVDEALSVGDVFFQLKCYSKFMELKESGKTILFVSHDLNSVIKYCDTVLLLNKGCKLSEDKPKEVVDHYKKLISGKTSDVVTNIDEKVDLNEERVIWKTKLNINPRFLEYGSKEIEIIDYSIEDNTGRISSVIEKNTMFVIKVKIRFHIEGDPIVAFTIKNLKGDELTGTNTFLEEKMFRDIKIGAYRTVIFKQKMTLQGGEYFLSIGCTTFENGSLKVYHRLYDIVNLKVISIKNTVGYFDMNSMVEII